MNANEPKVVLAKKLYCDKAISLDDICATLKMSRSTIYRALSPCGPTRKATANVAPVDDRRFLTVANSSTALVFGRFDSFPIATTSSGKGRCPENR
jgi:hypothetical protein